METFEHNFDNLMKQLGFSEDKAIRSFLEKNKHLSHDILLEDAPFWSSSQATFLREEILNDSNWAAAIDQLNSIVHEEDIDELNQILNVILVENLNSENDI